MLRGAVQAVLVAVVFLVLTARFVLTLPSTKQAAYRLVARRRRARATLLLDAALARVGAYVVGNLVTSGVAGAAMWLFLLLLGVPHAGALGLLIAVADLIPLVGALAGGIVVAVVALSVSTTTALVTVGFTVVFRQLEDYLLTPRVMAKAVDVQPLVSILAVLVGGALLGITGALLAVPAAACVQLLLLEVTVPAQERK